MPGEPDPRPTLTGEPVVSARPRFAGPGPGALVAVGVGGALGSVARYEIALALPRSPGGFPWATYLVNVTGSLVLGVVATLVLERWPPTRYVRPFVGIGVCGGYTTWSTFMTDAVVLMRDGYGPTAGVYLAATLACGLGATYLGIALGRLWPVDGRRPA